MNRADRRGFYGAVLAGGPLDGVIVSRTAPALRHDWYLSWPNATRSLLDRLLFRKPKLGRYRGWKPGRYVRIQEANVLTYGWVPYSTDASRAIRRTAGYIGLLLLAILGAYAYLTADATGPLLGLSIGDVFLRLLADDKEFAKDVTQKAGTAGDKAGKNMGQRMGMAAKAGITAFGAGAGYLLAGAVEAGANFEDQLRTINTVAGLTDDELSAVGDSIQGLSRETGKSTDDLTAGFYDLVSAGVPAKDAINVLRDSAKFATGALGTTGEAVDLVTSAMNAYGLEAKDSSRITDIFAKAVADGKVTAAQLGASIAQIAPIAASAGVSLEEVSSGFAILTAKGVPAAQAATQMRAAISALLTPNKQLNDLQEQTGINFAKLAREKGLAVALEELRKATNGNNDAFAKALGSIDAYQFALASTGENAEAFSAQIAETGDVTGLATAQYEEASKSSKKWGERMAAVFNTFVQDVGGAAGVLAPFLMTVNHLGPAMRGLISPAKLLGSALGGLVGFLTTGLIDIARSPRISKAAGGIGKAISMGVGKAIAAGSVLADTIGSAFGKVAGSAPVKRSISVLGKALGKSLGLAMAAGGAIGSALASAFDALPLSPAIKGALTRAGGLMGRFIGAAMIAGFALSLPLIAMQINEWAGNEFEDKVGPQFKDAGEQAAAALASGELEGLKAAQAAIHQAIADSHKIPPSQAKIAAQNNLFALNKELEAAIAAGGGPGTTIVKGTVTAIEYGTDEVAAATRLMATQGVGAASDDAYTAGNEVGGEVPAGVGAGILEQQGQVDEAMATLTNLIENERTPAQQAAHVIGQLISTEVSDGLRSSRAGVKDAAQTVRETGEAELRAFIASGGKIGKKAMDALAEGQKSKNGHVRKQSERTLAIINEELAKLKPKAKEQGAAGMGGLASGIDSKKATVRNSADGVRKVIRNRFNFTDLVKSWGANLTSAYADGIRTARAVSQVRAAARYVAGVAAGPLEADSPPKDPTSPLHKIDVWGERTMEAYADGLEKGGRTAADVLHRVLSGPQGFSVPVTASGVWRGGAGLTDERAAMASQGGLTVNVPIQGVLKARSVRDIQGEMVRLGQLRQLPGQRIAPLYDRREFD